MDIVRYLRRRWLTIKQEDGFAGLEPWAAVEIANGELWLPSVVVVLCSSCRRTRYQGPRRPHASVDPDLHLKRRQAHRSERPRPEGGRVRDSQFALHAQCRTLCGWPGSRQVVRRLCAVSGTEHPFYRLARLDDHHTSARATVSKQPATGLQAYTCAHDTVALKHHRS